MEAIGILYLAILFIACFIVVHTVKLALLGLRSTREKHTEQKKPDEQPPAEPVYYIVEKKQKRKKADYSSPREIRFKESEGK